MKRESSKYHFVCSRPECDNESSRYRGQIRNYDRLYCSAACRYLDQGRFISGDQNPNFKSGEYVNPTCDCGAEKDPRSKFCAECAGRGYAIGTKKSLDDYFSKGDKREGYIRTLVIKHNLIEYRCDICDNPGEWMGEPLTLDLDHINGDPTDNRLKNLRFLCPNCHNQTPTYGSKNIKREAPSAPRFKHGSTYAFLKKKCPCEICTAAKDAYNQALREKRKAR